MNSEQLSKVEAALRELHTTAKPQYWGDNLPITLANDLDIGTDWGVGVQQINATNGPAWKICIPAEGATAWVDSWMLSAHSQGDQRLVAHEFIQFSLQAEMQARIAVPPAMA